MVKEQKARISELSRTKQEIVTKTRVSQWPVTLISSIWHCSDMDPRLWDGGTHVPLAKGKWASTLSMNHDRGLGVLSNCIWIFDMLRCDFLAFGKRTFHISLFILVKRKIVSHRKRAGQKRWIEWSLLIILDLRQEFGDCVDFCSNE